MLTESDLLGLQKGESSYGLIPVKAALKQAENVLLKKNPIN